MAVELVVRSTGIVTFRFYLTAKISQFVDQTVWLQLTTTIGSSRLQNISESSITTSFGPFWLQKTTESPKPTDSNESLIAIIVSNVEGRKGVCAIWCEEERVTRPVPRDLDKLKKMNQNIYSMELI